MTGMTSSRGEFGLGDTRTQGIASDSGGLNYTSRLGRPDQGPGTTVPSNNKNVTPKLDVGAGFDFSDENGLEVKESVSKDKDGASNDNKSDDEWDWKPKKKASPATKRSIMTAGGMTGDKNATPTSRKFDFGLEDDEFAEEAATASEYGGSLEYDASKDGDDFEDFEPPPVKCKKRSLLGMRAHMLLV
eukprot:CAMPEP_0184494604 /NCGR_PEP_ID=MMETSP0113_2-20130426/29111_1 /TAXON_ID=91329 /ORGANISM="Norrisiella sphaerica, Strain BC52" /LENGTH=187 /DNA_ID=CAMNT_0026880423 /DNA_START=21 /DNA_END=581 /DNA_ORIENTATION=+